jgi:hypothetical protein
VESTKESLNRERLENRRGVRTSAGLMQIYCEKTGVRHPSFNRNARPFYSPILCGLFFLWAALSKRTGTADPVALGRIQPVESTEGSLNRERLEDRRGVRTSARLMQMYCEKTGEDILRSNGMHVHSTVPIFAVYFF